MIDKMVRKFKCGCFEIIYIDLNGNLQAGLSCCEKHEHPYATVEDYYLSNNEEE